MKPKSISSETSMFPKKIYSRGIKYTDKYIKIENLVADFGKFCKDYTIIHCKGKSSIVVVKKNKILLTRQYRLLINKLSYEIPGGAREKQESFKKAAARECYEETGIICKKIKHLISYNTALEYINNYNNVFYSKYSDDKNIKKNCLWVPIKNCMEMIRSKDISDSVTILSILAYNNSYACFFVVYKSFIINPALSFRSLPVPIILYLGNPYINI